jgi:hypothetical protein
MEEMSVSWDVTPYSLIEGQGNDEDGGSRSLEIKSTMFILVKQTRNRTVIQNMKLYLE